MSDAPELIEAVSAQVGGGERLPHEQSCENEVGGVPCGWFIGSEPLTHRGFDMRGDVEPVVGDSASISRCRNGHRVDDGDTMCLTCGASIGSTGTADHGADRSVVDDAPLIDHPTEIGEWTLEEALPSHARPWRRFLARAADGRHGVLTLYDCGAEPDPAVHDVLRRMDRDHVPVLMATGRWGEQRVRSRTERSIGTVSMRRCRVRPVQRHLAIVPAESSGGS